MISSKWGHSLDRVLGPVATKVTVSPNVLTFIGFIISVIAAVIIPFNIVAGGFLILFGGLFDVLDGLVARVNKRVSAFGAFLDSVLDRFSDAFIFSAIGLYLYQGGDAFHAVISMFALFTAFGVSYARARAEGLGYECQVGIMERSERILLISLGCIIYNILIFLVWIVLVGNCITVLQRIMHVKKKAVSRAR